MQVPECHMSMGPLPCCDSPWVMPVGNSSPHSFTRLFELIRLRVTHDDVSSEPASLLCEKRGPSSCSSQSFAAKPCRSMDHRRRWMILKISWCFC